MNVSDVSTDASIHQSTTLPHVDQWLIFPVDIYDGLSEKSIATVSAHELSRVNNIGLPYRPQIFKFL